MKNKLVYGVGLNDVDEPARLESGRKCPIYAAWFNMLTRCYNAAYQRERPTYTGCSVAPEWLKFSAFRTWMQRHDWQGKQLDKDILFPGNKVYSHDACVFVPSALNSFLTDRGRDQGDFPIGVCWHQDAGKFVSRCSNPFTGKRERLGYFDSPVPAHEAWRARKHEHAIRYADQQTDPRVAAALRTRFAPEATP
jgi:hypothetical protein